MKYLMLALFLLPVSTNKLMAAGSAKEIDSACPLAVNEVLKELGLKNYKMEKDSRATHGLRETGELADGTKVSVESSGCDALRTVYTFSYADSKTPVSNSKHWLALAGKSMNTLKKEVLAKFIAKQKMIPIKGPQSVDSMLTLVKSGIHSNRTGTQLFFETELAIFVE